MSALLAPLRYSRQPPPSASIDFSSPYAAGLVFASMPAWKLSCYPENLTLTESTAGVQGYTNKGVSRKTSATNNAFYSILPFTSQTNYSMLCVAANPASTQRSQMLTIGDEVLNNNTMIFLGLNSDKALAAQSGWFVFLEYSAGVHVASDTGAAGFADGLPHVYSATRYSNSTSNIWFDGKLVTVNTTTGGSAVVPQSKVYVSADGFSNATWVQDNILSLIWNRSIPDSWMAVLGVNPWQIFKPAFKRNFIYAGAAASAYVPYTSIYPVLLAQ